MSEDDSVIDVPFDEPNDQMITDVIGGILELDAPQDFKCRMIIRALFELMEAK